MAIEKTLVPAPPSALPGESRRQDIINVLNEYFSEADMNRKSGLNPRDDKWRENLDLYWNRFNFDDKAAWQARETMPEVPNFVDRFAAATKEALVATPEGFYTVHDPADREHDLTDTIKRMNDVWLSTVGRNQLGHPLAFPAFFEEQMKMGALMAASAVVTWKNDVPGGRVAAETVDPRNVWLDHTGRGLYRIRRTELDFHQLYDLPNAKTPKGQPLFDLEEVDRLVSGIAIDMQREREEASGHGQEVHSGRKPVILDEYIATVVGPGGKLLARNELMVVANGQYLIRGPEPIPFWHGKDWLIYSPLVTAPLSVYGRSYMEDFGSLAKTFNELTNLILDAVRVSGMNAFVMVPGMLINPSQANTGIHPGKTFLIEEGFQPDQFASELNLGTLDQGAVTVWEAMKRELAEAAGINEIGLGQFAPNSRTSATEISMTQQSSSAIVRSVAQTVETRFLDPFLDLSWKTGLQHAKRGDKRLELAAGPEMYNAILTARKELVSRPVTFQARGISALIQKASMLQQIMQMLQIIGSNENLLAAFMQQIDMAQFVALILHLTNVDITKMQPTPRQQMMQQMMAPVMDRASQGTPTEAGSQQMGQVAQMLGVARV